MTTLGLPNFESDYLLLQDRVAQIERLIRRVPESGVEANAGGAVLFARKTANESVTSSTVLQDDDELFLGVVANAVYEMTSVVLYTSSTTPDMKTQYAVPTGAALTGTTIGVNSAAAFDMRRLGTSQIDYASFTDASVLNRGLLVMGTTAGTIQYQWAQLASDVTALTVLADSFLLLRQVV